LYILKKKYQHNMVIVNRKPEKLGGKSDRPTLFQTFAGIMGKYLFKSRGNSNKKLKFQVRFIFYFLRR
jgi:hypothetical protein